MEIPQRYRAVFDRLRGLEPAGSKWDAYCPAHDDQNKKSLSVGVGDRGNLILKCHAPSACSFGSICAALGIRECETFADEPYGQGNDKAKREFVEGYDYKARDGTPRYQVVRWRVKKEDGAEAKTFSQRRRNPDFNGKEPPGQDNPEWLWNVPPELLCLYRLPELDAAVRERPDRWVFVIEGEKAVDWVRALGLTATCAPMGATHWTQLQYATELRGYNVVVVPDNDPIDEQLGERPGDIYARDAALSLTGVAKTVRVLRTGVRKEKGGLDDWFVEQGVDGPKSPKARSVLKVLADMVAGTREYVPEATRSAALAMAAAKRDAMKGGLPMRSAAELYGRFSFALNNLLFTAARFKTPEDAAIVREEVEEMAGMTLAALEQLPLLPPREG